MSRKLHSPAVLTPKKVSPRSTQCVPGRVATKNSLEVLSQKATSRSMQESNHHPSKTQPAPPPLYTPIVKQKAMQKGRESKHRIWGKEQRALYLLRIRPPLMNVPREANWSLGAVGEQTRTCPYGEMRLSSPAFSLSIYCLSCLFHDILYYFNTMYRVSVIILYYGQQMHNYFTNYKSFNV